MRLAITHALSTGRTYPPRGDNGLRTLHKHICESKVSAHHKLSVFYYLLLDYDVVRGMKSQLAEEFAASSGLPRKYQILMHGLWHMDRNEFKVSRVPRRPVANAVVLTSLCSTPSSTSLIPPYPPNSPTRSSPF